MSQDETVSTEHQEPTADREGSAIVIEETRRVRRWVRVEPVAGSPLAGALWPLLAFLVLLLYGVTSFARRSVESVVRERVGTELAQQGLGFASVEVSGQNVVLRGTPPAPGDGDRALLIADRTVCPTLWFGRWDCTIDVRGAFQAPAPAAPAPARTDVRQADSCDRELGDLLARSRIRFEPARSDVQPSSRPLLAEIAAVAARCPGRLRVEGHTDDRGRDEANQRLSQARAEAVCNVLVAEGVDRERLVAAGLGETRPIVPNTTADGRARNRRIEIRVVRE